MKLTRALALLALLNLVGCALKAPQYRIAAPDHTLFGTAEIRGRIIDADTLAPLAGVRVYNGNFPSLQASSTATGDFVLPAAQAREVTLQLPSAGRAFQPLQIELDGYPPRQVWLDSEIVKTSDRAAPRARVQVAGYMLLQRRAPSAVESLDETALPALLLRNPIRGCDAEAWAPAAEATFSARRLARQIDQHTEPLALGSEQALMLTDSYQQMAVAWQMVERGCHFASPAEREQAAPVFLHLQREAQAMREALDLVGQ